MVVILLFLAASMFGEACSRDDKQASGSSPRVLIETGLGNIVVELDARRAPVTTSNFLRYVDERRYEGASFYRTVTMDNQPHNKVKIEVIQGGHGLFGNHEMRLPAIRQETTRETGILHKDGTISMARIDPASATSEIFICIGDQPELDFGGERNTDGQGFAAFGRVVDGMDVVRKIQKQPADGQTLQPPVRITNVKRVSDSEKG